MKSLFILLVLLVAIFQAPKTQAAGLMINASEIGVGKFHRYDNMKHPYPQSSVWTPFILPNSYTNAQTTPVIYSNANGSVTIQFTNLEELLRAVVMVSQQQGQKVAVLNIHGHGMPGGMWFPRDAAQLKSSQCASWRRSAAGSDQGNYDQYYTPVSKSDVMSIRQMGQTPAVYPCVTSFPDWRNVVARVPAIKEVFAEKAQIHFASCVVGLGPVGEAFTKSIAQLLLNPALHGLVKTSVNFGLGDWSMPEGMGFWDYFSDDQLNRDNAMYPKTRRDRDVAHKGTIRVASYNGDGWITSLVENQNFMMMGFQYPGFSNSDGPVRKNFHQPFAGSMPAQHVRVPGTGVYVDLMQGGYQQ